jgi:Zn-dependent alcohol dehydrogenase
VAYAPNPEPNWKIEEIKILRPPRNHELKIRMVATGICHSDIFVASNPSMPGLEFPRVLGHEGAGIVEEVGPGVSVAKVGDPVLLSFNFCKQCDMCTSHQASYCLKFNDLNTMSVPGTFENTSDQTVGAGFFGQSSFAGMSIVNEGVVVNVKDLLQDEEELKLMAPLGCGIMTGSGAVANVAKPTADDIIMVTGLGGVGLAAVMTAKLLGCKHIIAVDRVGSRLDMARELGADVLLDTSAAGFDLAKEARKAVEGQRITHVIETTAVPVVIAAAVAAMAKRGRFIQLGVPKYDAELKLAFSDFFHDGKTFECHYLGDTTGQEYIPRMIEWYRQGKFPLDKIVKFFPASAALEALHGMESGSAIKPVIVW